MTVTFGTTPYSNWQCLAPLLKALGCVTPTSIESSKPHSIDLTSEMPAEGMLLLAYASPQQTLANAMEQGAAPTEVLSQWVAHTKAMIECFKANRKRVVLINIDAARQSMSQSAITLGNHWQQQIELPEGQVSDSQHPPAEANPYYWMLATLAVHQSHELPLLLAQLEACTLPIGESATAPVQEIDHLYSELTALFQQCESSQVLAQAHKALKEEYQTFEAQHANVLQTQQKDQTAINSAQAEREALQRQLKKEQADHAALKALNATLEKEHTTLQSAKKAQEIVLNNASEEHQLLLEQLHLVQEELERHITAGKEATSEKASLQHQLEARQKAHQQLEKEHASLKQAQQKDQSIIKEVNAEQEKLQSALKKGQLALTKINAEKSTLEHQLKALNATHKDQAKQLADLQAQKTELLKQCEAAEKQKVMLQKEQTDHAQTKAEKLALEGQHRKAQQEAEASLSNVEHENQLLLQQLHLVQEAFEAKFLQAKEQEKELARRESQLKYSEQQHQHSVNAHHASQKENLLLQRRLAKLREIMEGLERSNKVLNGNMSEVKNQLAAARKHQSDWEYKYQQAEREGALALASANRRIYDLNKELNSITKSPRWKLVSPLNSHGKKNKKVRAEQLQQQKKQVANSGLFDAEWYLQAYPDIAEAAIDPIEHYLKMGAYEGRNPSEVFDTSWYLLYYQDVTNSGLNPLVHYIRYGQKENRATRPGALASLPAPTQQPVEKG
ncbi:hypothetical protein M0220_13445 [Halomonas qinghailakensis]|uniref:Uncharacterized protein n=1 Tax=Halomonas qinghailakensis TaxID=2937790 RepID=A0AA46TPL2_9GAMM|nr:hypothetical protein [Halomonas sp. ZZQ-149]UYO73873.1 hypothetical protein M0220_13445 [Halomonas sp. ZZQ-149]